MKHLPPFALERYFATHEFSAQYLLSASDCEALTLRELLAEADDDSLRSWRHLHFGYTHSQGLPALRESIAALYRGISADEVLVTAPEEGIFLLMHALLNPGDHVICSFPGYQSLYELARAIGCSVSFWQPCETRGWHFDVDRLAGLLQSRTRLIVVNFPHNPTGFTPSPEDFSAIVELARRKNAYLLSDEMYRFLEIDGQPTLAAGCELYGRGVSLGGLSKSFGLPGLRIGWLATRDPDLIETAGRLRDYTTICNSAPSEALALMALRGGDRIPAMQRQRLDRNLKRLNAFASENADFMALVPPRGGTVCFPRLLKTEDTFRFCRTLVEKAGIMLVPSKIFGYGNRHVRIGFGRENFAEALERLGDFIDRNL